MDDAFLFPLSLSSNLRWHWRRRRGPRHDGHDGDVRTRAPGGRPRTRPEAMRRARGGGRGGGRQAITAFREEEERGSTSARNKLTRILSRLIKGVISMEMINASTLKAVKSEAIFVLCG